jgi:glutamate racemase
LLSQGEIVADSLHDYLERHPEIEKEITRGGKVKFYTTDSEEDFEAKGSIFYGEQVKASHIDL